MKAVKLTFRSLGFLAFYSHLVALGAALDCDSSPCQHTGLCIGLNAGYICSCVGPWKGIECAEPDNCYSGPCKNGATCTSSGTTYTCKCTTGFTGKNCDVATSSSSTDHKECGCFTTNATVTLESGQRVAIQDVAVGDRVLSFDNSGKLIYSEIAMWMDRVPQAKHDLIQITTHTGKQFKATPYHMVLVGDTFTQMRHVKVGDELLLTDDGEQLHKEKVNSIAEIHDGVGVFAPLSYEGTIIVDGVAASCYAFSHRLGQIVFAPMKLMSRLGVVSGKADGMHWYARMLVDAVEALSMKDVLLQ